MTRRVMVANRSNAQILKAIADHGDGNRIKLLAQGDSWFAFPLPAVGGPRNLIDAISTTKKTVAIDISISGDTAENMAQGDRLAQFSRILNGAIGHKPIEVAAILLSAGGNDLIDRMADLVGTVARRVRRKAGAGLTEEQSRQIHEETMALLGRGSAVQIYEDVIHHITQLIAVRKGGPNASLPVVLHGYCHVTPRDSPAISLPMKVGPWIWKRLTPLGYTQSQQQSIAKAVIDEFNRRLGQLRNTAERVHVLDFRNLQEAGKLPVADPKELGPTTFWHDEIHLNCAGWECIAANAFNPLMDQLLSAIKLPQEA